MRLDGGKTVRACISLLISILIFGLVLGHVDTGSSIQEASSKVALAETAVATAFQATLEAESAGANVSILLVGLNEAGALLAEAEMAVRNGDLAHAADAADRCSEIANSVVEDSPALRSSALQNAQVALRNSVMFSFASAVVFLAALILAWFLFKRSYHARMLKMKIEVRSDAEAK